MDVMTMHRGVSQERGVFVLLETLIRPSMKLVEDEDRTRIEPLCIRPLVDVLPLLHLESTLNLTVSYTLSLQLLLVLGERFVPFHEPIEVVAIDAVDVSCELLVAGLDEQILPQDSHLER
ncbi:hypothetical protein Pan265_02660 [Mucisphaera calidilacus]|uniref:Uncharacterized protein n=1 Tax=Mucisphaera calidilacus TaxID=2527982 RepID=A0A518BTZ7_9BACT|nr:hypothetical protein Pan265_02660 [Mucisphaera calidilacus]